MSRFHELRVATVRPETRDAVVVTFDVPAEARGKFRYEAGQHLTLKTLIDGEEVRRSYSICSSAQEQQLRIAVKRVADGFFSSWAHETLAPGHAIEVMPPAGHFGVPLQPKARRHHVAFASGSGITPVLSIIKTVLEGEPASVITLFYGNRASSGVMFKEELEDLKDRHLTRLNLVFVLSREQQDIDLLNGRIDRAKCDALLEKWVDPADIDVAYICGPQTMMEEVSESLKAHGVDKARIRLELFDNGLVRDPRMRKAVPVQGAPECKVTVVLDGRTHSFGMLKNHQAVLDAALENGIELPYSCKGGVCSTCRCKKIKGEVDMDAVFALEDYEIERGFVLACQSFPVSDELVIDFDARDA
jgi:ring-1,2-phenylacetyl-CoA epoxidase subunit PaaE